MFFTDGKVGEKLFARRLNEDILTRNEFSVIFQKLLVGMKLVKYGSPMLNHTLMCPLSKC